MTDKLIFYFQYPFVRYALIVGVLIALCSSLLGVTLVLKRFSFICLLSFDVYVKKMMIEHIIDGMNPESEHNSKKKK